jgi:hypothetical protein
MEDSAMGDMADASFEGMEPCVYCVDMLLYRTRPLNEHGDCPINPDEQQKCPLIRDAHGLPPLDEEEKEI